MVVCLLAAAFVFCLLAAAFVFSFLDPLVEFYCILARLIESDPKPLSVCLALVYPRASSSCRLNVVLSMLASCCCCRVGVLFVDCACVALRIELCCGQTDSFAPLMTVGCARVFPSLCWASAAQPPWWGCFFVLFFFPVSRESRLKRSLDPLDALLAPRKATCPVSNFKVYHVRQYIAVGPRETVVP